MCCRRKQPPEGSQRDSVTDKKRPEEGSTNRDAQEKPAEGAAEQGAQPSSQKERKEGVDGTENVAEKQTTDKENKSSSRKASFKKSKELLKLALKPSKEFLNEDCPIKVIEQARTGTAAVDDAEFGWTDGTAGGLRLFTKSADSAESFGKSSEMLAQKKEKKEALFRRKVELSMTQSVPADMRTRVEENA